MTTMVDRHEPRKQQDHQCREHRGDGIFAHRKVCASIFLMPLTLELIAYWL
jgi:hypothetical protein